MSQSAAREAHTRTVTLINRGGPTEETPGINGTRREIKKIIIIRERIELANAKKRFDNTSGCSSPEALIAHLHRSVFSPRSSVSGRFAVILDATMQPK